MTIAAPILLVESDRDLAEGLARELMADGYRVELARSAHHARLLASECPPRMAMLGAFESPRGALTLLEEIRGARVASDCWARGLPVLVICPEREQLEVLRAFDAGADDVMAVPLGYLELRGVDFNSRRPSDFKS